jgi:signal transduction histidine kinase
MRSSGTPARGELFPPELDALWSNPVVRKTAAAAQHLRRAAREHPVVLDSLLAVLVLVNGLVDLYMPRESRNHGSLPHPLGLVILTIVGQSVPLIWRRRAPAAVLTTVVAASVLQWGLGVQLWSTTGLMIALYSMARYDWIKRLPWAALGTAAALTVGAFRVDPFKVQPWTSLFLLWSAATAAIAVALVVRVRQAQLDALADRAAQAEVEREQRVQLATFAERSRVSREMHDIVGHNLAVIIGLADGAKAAPDAARSAEVLAIIASTGRQALSELRRTLGAMRGPRGTEPDATGLNPQPGIADLAGLLERIQAAGPRISYRTVGDPDALEPGLQLTVYRIVQEALTNSLKHAGADTTVQVALRVTDERVEVSVRDTGPRKGTPAPASAGPPGQGLLGMSERAALAGGSAQAAPVAGGWLVHAVLPLSPPHTRAPTHAPEEDQT